MIDRDQILSAKAEESKDDRPPPPMCPPGREPKWNDSTNQWECVDIKPPAENAPKNEVSPAVDPRKQLQEKAKEFADACNTAVDAGVSVMEVMTIAQQTLLGMQNQ